MGILLAFMFLWNMVGALVLLPALARWLLAPARSALGTTPAAPTTPTTPPTPATPQLPRNAA